MIAPNWDMIGIGLLIGFVIFGILLALYLFLYPRYEPTILKNKLDLEKLKLWVKQEKKKGLSYEEIEEIYIKQLSKDKVKISKIKLLLGFKNKNIKLIKKAIELAKKELINYGEKEDGRKIEESGEEGDNRTETNGNDTGREADANAEGDSEPTEHRDVQKRVFSETRRNNKYFN